MSVNLAAVLKIYQSRPLGPIFMLERKRRRFFRAWPSRELFAAVWHAENSVGDRSRFLDDSRARLAGVEEAPPGTLSRPAADDTMSQKHKVVLNRLAVLSCPLRYFAALSHTPGRTERCADSTRFGCRWWISKQECLP